MPDRMTGADPTAIAHYERACHQLRCLIGDPLASVDAALAQAPDFVMAHALRAYLHLLGTEPDGVAVARDQLNGVVSQHATAPERAHLAAIGHLVDGRWHQAGRVLEDLTIDDPLDVLALQVGHQVDFFTGQGRMLRDRVARALPAWDPSMPAYHAVLGMYAFGLEEMGDYRQAEDLGRRAVAMQPRDTWAQHAVAHVLEMEGRVADGITWMTADTTRWAEDSFFSVHNWWHLALYHLEQGDAEQVLALYDGPIRGGQSAIVLEMIDASAMLWRLSLLGVDVGDRWQALADQWLPFVDAGNYAFNDAHAMMAFTRAGRDSLADRLLAQQTEAMRRDDDNATFTREIGYPVTRAIRAFDQADYATTIDLLRPARAIANRFGGSHAQRDLLDLTLLEAALRADRTGLARALSAERLAAKPTSPLATLFARRSRLVTA